VAATRHFRAGAISTTGPARGIPARILAVERMLKDSVGIAVGDVHPMIVDRFEVSLRQACPIDKPHAASRRADQVYTRGSSGALEPGAGEGHGTGATCLNCGTALAGPYCHSCGQQGHVHRTLTAFWHDLAHGALHFEGKIWHTLPLLAWRPGELTRRYVEGERARFVSPIALFLFSIFLMFAVIHAVGGPVDGTSEARRAAQADTAEREELTAKLARLHTGRADALRKKQRVAKIEEEIKAVRQEIAIRNAVEGKTTTADGGSFVDIDPDPSWGWLGEAIGKAKENPSLLFYKLQTNAYKFSWALIPISVPFVWLLFLWRRQYRVYDHTVFVTYSLSFMTLLVVTASLVRAIGLGEGWSVSALIFLPPLHMYRQLRGAYALSRLSAVWRTVFLIVFALTAATLFFVGLLALGVIA